MVIMVEKSNKSTCGSRGSVSTALLSRCVAGKQIYLDKLVVTCSVQRWKVEILDLINKLAYLQQISVVVFCNFLNFCVFL